MVVFFCVAVGGKFFYIFLKKKRKKLNLLHFRYYANGQPTVHNMLYHVERTAEVTFFFIFDFFNNNRFFS